MGLRPFLLVLIALVLLAGCSRDEDIATRRAEVHALLDSVEWPEGYERSRNIEGHDPNLDVFTRQAGSAQTSFEASGRGLGDVRDDFHERLVEAGFEYIDDAPLCSQGLLRMEYDHEQAGVITTTLEFDEKLSRFPVSVRIGWDIENLPGDDVLAENIGDVSLPTCSAER